MKRGNGIAAVAIIVIILVIVLVILFRRLYERSPADFGTWSEVRTTLCLNDGQACTVEGTSLRYRRCIPNPETGNGCIDANGKHTFRDEEEVVSCRPLCFTSAWDNDVSTPCAVYDDIAGTTLAASQTCRNDNPVQYTYSKLSRTCAAKDPTGTNACVKVDGSLATVGETEQILFPCNTIPECYPGVWQSCPPPIRISENCGGPAGDCGRVVASSQTAVCTIETSPGVFEEDVTDVACNPLDNPGPCPVECFNYPCTTYPAGYAAFLDLFGDFIEMFDNVAGNYIEVDFQTITFPIALNGIDVTSGSNIVTVNAPGHSFLNGYTVDIAGITGPIGGIPDTNINTRHFVSGVTVNTFNITVPTSATSTTSGGGGGGSAFQNQLARASAPEPILNTGPPILTIFDSAGATERIRFRFIPSQSEAANGGFYLIGYLPYNGEAGIVDWNGSVLVIKPLPILTVGQTYDDVAGLQLFTLTDDPEPYRLQLYAVGPTIGPEVSTCGGVGCIEVRNCNSALAGTGTCT